MTPRFRSRGSTVEYVGTGSQDDVTGESSGRRFPNADDGLLTVFRDFATGEAWYFQDGGWRLLVTTESLILAELKGLRQAVDESRAAMVAVQEQMLEALQKIA